MFIVYIVYIVCSCVSSINDDSNDDIPDPYPVGTYLPTYPRCTTRALFFSNQIGKQKTYNSLRTMLFSKQHYNSLE